MQKVIEHSFLISHEPSLLLLQAHDGCHLIITILLRKQHHFLLGLKQPSKSLLFVFNRHQLLAKIIRLLGSGYKLFRRPSS